MLQREFNVIFYVCNKSTWDIHRTFWHRQPIGNSQNTEKFNSGRRFFYEFLKQFQFQFFLHFFVALILLSFFIFLSSCLFLIFWLVLLVQIIFVCENSSWIVSFYFYDSIFFQLCFSFFCVFVWWVEDNVKLSQKWNTKKKSFRSSVRLLRVNLWWGEWNDRKICVFFFDNNEKS